ncbi:MAG: metal ABC transporter ATP-binding protein [Dehalococcoidia bacterium]
MTSSASAPAAAPPLRVRDLSVRLGDRLALDRVSFEVAPGSFLGLIGPNGSGKSTLLRSILGILPVAGGRVEAGGLPLERARHVFAYLPQRSALELDLPLRAQDVVMMGRLRHSGWLRSPSKHDREVVADALSRVGLSDRRNSPISEMSFGQQQRVLFARALAQEGRIILLDEPMNGVDAQTQRLFLEVLASFKAEGRSVIMATHDLNQVAENCDTICVLSQHLIAYGPTAETLTESVLQEAYGLHLHFMHGGEGTQRHLDHIFEESHHHEHGDTH